MKKILMVATCNFLTNRNDGGRQCSYRNYDILCQIFGVENVYLYMITNDEVKESERISIFLTYSNKIQQIWWALGLRIGYSRKTMNQIIENINRENFDYIWFDRSTLGGICKKVQTKAKKVFFFHNVEKKYIQNKILHESVGYLVSYPAFLVNERNAVKKADKIVCLNSRDSELVKAVYRREADLVFPISFSDIFDKKEVLFEKTSCRITGKLLFIGSFFQPNIDGIEWFINNIMCQFPDIKLTVVGKGLEKKATDWQRVNVQIVGTVQDVGEYYKDSDAVVLPIFYGDGMKVKTAEALMYGKAIFATREALEGYETEEQPDIFECNTKEEFINAIKKCYMIKRESNISYSNRQLFLDKYENMTLTRKLKELFN